jgi:hypothetical protein
VQIVHRLIDYLHGDRPPPADGAAPERLSYKPGLGPDPVVRC